MPLIGTAGHVDHGKSTLVEQLTGRDPDRWAEEKRRGLTIDLGFAWTTLPDGTEVSFVDVPGHERYLKNMLAGIEAVDVALLVVAADEGWMPQSEEHLAVLDLLEVESGVVALTKSDLVESDLLELAEIETAERLVGTSLEGSTIVPVSGTTGEGTEALVTELQRLVTETEPVDLGRPRLWVDRSFTASGAGTVVTGTLLDGSLEIDDAVVIFPDLIPSRIRGIQSHEKAMPSSPPGRRVALNLSGVERGDVTRGDMVGRPDHWELSNRLVATLQLARYVEEFKRRGAYQLHFGTSARPLEIHGMDDGIVVMTTTSLPMAVGDRFIIRDTGRKLVVAGGRVLDPDPAGTQRALQSARSIDPGGEPNAIAGELLDIRGSDTAARITAHSRGGRPSHGRQAGSRLISRRVFDELAERAGQLVAAEHEAHPLRVGLPVATLAAQLSAGPEVIEQVVDQTDDLERVGPDVAVAGHEIALDSAAEASWDRAREALGKSLAVPTTSELNLDAEVLHLKLRNGELVRVSDDLVLLPEQEVQVRELLTEMPNDFTVADFRDAAGLSRKYAVPLLEWADKEGLTVRRGDSRTLR